MWARFYFDELTAAHGRIENYFCPGSAGAEGQNGSWAICHGHSISTEWINTMQLVAYLIRLCPLHVLYITLHVSVLFMYGSTVRWTKTIVFAH
jgi:hypothetical protein